MNDRMLEPIFSLSVSLVCILHHLCRATTWLADVLLSLILRLPPTEKQNFATASHSQSKVEPGRVIFGMTAQDLCAIWEISERF